MSEPKALQAGDPCPNCGGFMAVDEAQASETIVDRVKRNAASPSAAQRYAEATEAKAAEFGVIHKCVRCGYQARYEPKAA